MKEIRGDFMYWKKTKKNTSLLLAASVILSNFQIGMVQVEAEETVNLDAEDVSELKESIELPLEHEEQLIEVEDIETDLEDIGELGEQGVNEGILDKEESIETNNVETSDKNEDELGREEISSTVMEDELLSSSDNIEPYTADISESHADYSIADEATSVSERDIEKDYSWNVGNVGSGAAGTVTENEDGTITIEASGGKIADSEDGFTFYYTKLNPQTDNFTLTATFTVDKTTVGGKTYDGQSGFGVMAIDTIEVGNSSARYYNSAGAVFARYKNGSTTYNGIPGGRFVTGYTEGPTTSSSNRQLINNEVFDWGFNSENQSSASKPHYFEGETYTLTLRKSNTGYHAILNNDVTNEVIYYDYDNELLTTQEQDALYVGFMASRGVQVTVSDIDFKIISPEQDEAAVGRPIEYINPTISSDTTKTTSNKEYELSLKSNVNGTVTIKDEEGTILYENLSLDANTRLLNELILKQGENRFKVEFTPSENQPSLESYQKLSSYDTMTLNVNISCQAFGTSENALYVSANGSSSNEGTQVSPLDIYTAIAYAQPGQEIVLLEGTYYLDQAITIDRGHSGTAEERITLMAEPGKRVVIDLSNSPKGGFTLNADYWHFYGFEICNSQDNAKPILIQGNHNIIEQLKIYNNGTTGLQISGSSSESIEMWPSYNLIQSVESYNNMDSNANDADGFAAKITAGAGNVFRYCISHHNIDDGWDLYAKSISGSIGQVKVEYSIAYENGYLSTDPNKTVVGEGNGFKLGGESMPGNHILSHSISFNNYAKGVTSNSGPDVQIYNTLSFNNGGENLSLYTSYKETNYKLDHFISYNGGKEDNIDLKGQETLASETNYINGTNSLGEKISADWFTDFTLGKENQADLYPTINDNGGIDFNGLKSVLTHAEDFLEIMAHNKTEPTIIEIGYELGAEIGDEGVPGDDGETEVPGDGEVETPDDDENDTPGDGEIEDSDEEGTETPNKGESNTQEYVIPQSIKDVIDPTVLKPIAGHATKSSPLQLEVSSDATVDSIKQLLKGYKVTATIIPTRTSTVTYALTLENMVETHYLKLVVPTENKAVTEFLNELVNLSTTPDSKDENKQNQESNKNESVKPQTGYHDLMGWILGGLSLISLGTISSSKSRKTFKK